MGYVKIPILQQKYLSSCIYHFFCILENINCITLNPFLLKRVHKFMNTSIDSYSSTWNPRLSQTCSLMQSQNSVSNKEVNYWHLPFLKLSIEHALNIKDDLNESALNLTTPMDLLFIQASNCWGKAKICFDKLMPIELSFEQFSQLNNKYLSTHRS